MSIGWLFPKKTDGGFDGFNHSGLAHFAGAKFPSLVREIIQNSLDAHDPKAGKPVRVEFGMQEIETKDFPCRAQLQKIFEQCCKQLKTIKDEKAETFFARGLDILKGRKIRMLKVSDFNTTGLHGEGRDSLFYILTKAEGISIKRPIAGGSHGIGKNAPYILSRLHTVFYSTMYQEGGRAVAKAQGRSLLMSHGDENSKAQGIGYYGEEEGCSPILDDSVPDFLKRKEQGTTVCVAGFEESPRWEDAVLAAVLSSFFVAIDERKLSVSIGKNLTVDAESLRRNFDELLAKYPDDKDFDDVRLGRQLYDAFQQGEERDIQLRHGIGHCILNVLVGEGLAKQVGLIRNTGMMITAHQLGLRQFRGIGDFVAICRCDNDAGNKLLRDMENPRHDAFEPDWLGDAGKAKKGKKALEEWTNAIRQRITAIIAPDEGDSTPIDEMGEFFSADGGDQGKGKSEDLDFERGVVITRRPPPPLKRKKKLLPPPPPKPHPDDPVPQPTHKRAPIDIVNIRIVDGEGERERVAYFTPTESGKASLDFWIVGDSWDDQLQLTEETESKAQSVNLVKGKRTEFRFVAAQDVRGAMRVFAYKTIGGGEGK